jgi:glycosyltransferase involved in cell wall biosynthesis
MQVYVRSILEKYRIGAVVLLSSATSAYAPATVPFLADWGDVDSEKRFQYARLRFPGLPHWLEGYRLRQVERHFALRSRRTFLTTNNELDLFRQIAPDTPLTLSGNGVDCEYFNPYSGIETPTDLRSRKYIIFVGVLNYFPNRDGILWFAQQVFPELRRRDPGLELVLVGRNPTRDIMGLALQAGITVTGAVEDVRPYLAAARAVVVPLRIARGIQNKVLEALAMGKQVLASDAVCRTFPPDRPLGITQCSSLEDYLQAAAQLPRSPDPDRRIVDAARARFSWAVALEPLLTELDRLEVEISQAEKGAGDTIAPAKSGSHSGATGGACPAP